MRGPPTLALACLALAALLGPPAEAWYKQAAGPSYYSVGRASGLLSGVRRSPYMRRSDDTSTADSSAEGAPAAVASFLMAEPRQGPSGLRNMVSGSRVDGAMRGSAPWERGGLRPRQGQIQGEGRAVAGKEGNPACSLQLGSSAVARRVRACCSAKDTGGCCRHVFDLPGGLMDFLR